MFSLCNLVMQKLPALHDGDMERNMKILFQHEEIIYEHIDNIHIFAVIFVKFDWC